MVDINIHHFNYEASESVVIKNISLSIKEGECFVLAGKSGCGKSTLIRLLNRLIPTFYKGKLDGEIFIVKKNIDDYEYDELVEKVGCVFQNPSSQFFNVDTESEIAFGCENLGISREEIGERVFEAAKTLHISHLLGKNIFSLSGGEKQMIAIASIYAMGVDVILMDEPSANLDMKAIRQLEGLISILKKQGKTIIIAEHRLHYLKNLADHLVVLEEGKIKTKMSNKQLCEIDTEALHKLGLRAIDIEDQNYKWKGTEKESHDYLEISHLSVGYKRNIDVIKDMTINFNKGEITGIVGDNGKGKSTFAKCLCGMIKEREGKLCFEGRDFSYKKRLGKVYLVLQNTTSQLFSDSVIGELNLARKTSQSDCGYSNEEVLKMLELSGLSERHPMSLSGGEKQRLALAAGIVQNAGIMILDEPTSGLDYENMLSVKNILHMLEGYGKCVIVITHDIEFLDTVCDRVVKIEN